MEPLKLAIAGYGNLGRGVQQAISLATDLELVGVFSRRDPGSISAAGVPVYSLNDIQNFKTEIDVLILCGGSRDDLPVQSPELVADFNIVDSFDNHAKIPDHFAKVDEAAREANNVALISAGWDPGLFSLNRLIGEAVLPAGETYTFWGMGLSQGHSDALRRVEGVKHGVQYTVPIEAAIDLVRAGEKPELSTRDKHKRVCYVVLKDGADEASVRQEIVTMPDYFEPYDTTVNFISEEEFLAKHQGMPHGGFVMRSGESSPGTKQNIEFSLKLQSNPEFTASVLVAYARAVGRMSAAGEFGAKTIFDIPPGLLSPKSMAQLRQELL